MRQSPLIEGLAESLFSDARADLVLRIDRWHRAVKACTQAYVPLGLKVMLAEVPPDAVRKADAALKGGGYVDVVYAGREITKERRNLLRNARAELQKESIAAKNDFDNVLREKTAIMSSKNAERASAIHEFDASAKRVTENASKRPAFVDTVFESFTDFWFGWLLFCGVAALVLVLTVVLWVILAIVTNLSAKSEMSHLEGQFAKKLENIRDAESRQIENVERRIAEARAKHELALKSLSGIEELCRRQKIA